MQGRITAGPSRAGRNIVAACLVGSLTGTILAANPISWVSPDAAGVLVARDLEKSVGRLTRFLARSNPEYGQITQADLAAEFVELERSIGMEPGTCDFSKPFCVILTRPRFDPASNVFCFTPRPNAPIRAGLKGKPGTIHRIRSGGRRRYAIARDDFVFVSLRRRPIQTLGQVTPTRSLWARFDDRQKALYEDNDLTVHVSMDQWRDVIRPYRLLVAQVARLGMTSQSRTEFDAKATEALADWFVDGAGKIVDQMTDLTIAAAYDGDGFRLSHHHRFDPKGSVSGYLASVRRTNGPMLSGLPNRPFVMIFASNWRSPKDGSLMAEMARRVLGAGSPADRADAAKLREIIADSGKLYAQMRGMNMMLSTPGDAAQTVEIHGSYGFDDPAKGLELIGKLEAGSCDAMASFTPSGGYSCDIKRRRARGLEFDELTFDLESMDPLSRSMFEAMYGRTARVRQAVAGANRVVYSMTCRGETAFCDWVKASSEATPGGNSQVADMVRSLPQDPHMLLVADLGRTIAFSHHMMSAGMAAEGRKVDFKRGGAKPLTGSTVGWAASVTDTTFSGQARIATEDLTRALRYLGFGAASGGRAEHPPQQQGR